VTPRKKIAREKIQATWEFDHPNVSLNSLTRRPWKKLQAYTVPRQSMRTVPIAAMSQRVPEFSFGVTLSEISETKAPVNE
jgi:hypothetical protein